MAEAARREPPTTRLTPRVLAVTVTAPTPSLGLDELKTPDEFVCPITIEVIQDPVCASDGHTNERSEIEDVLALPEERRNPLMRATLQPFLFPINISRFALRRTSRKKAAQKAIEAKLTSVNHAVQIDDDAWRTLLSGELHVRRSGLFHRQAVSLAAAAHPTGGEQHRVTYTDAATGKASIGTVLGIDNEAPTKYEFEVVTAEGGSGHNWRVRCATKKDYADWTSALRTVVPPADLLTQLKLLRAAGGSSRDSGSVSTSGGWGPTTQKTLRIRVNSLAEFMAWRQAFGPKLVIVQPRLRTRRPSAGAGAVEALDRARAWLDERESHERSDSPLRSPSPPS